MMKEVGTSESIINQKEFLTKYVAQQPNWLLIDIYIDDGFTGTNFNRPSFIRLKEDIEQGKIDMVITKDLSRLGRDYIDTGYYLEKYFPTKNIRYIAVNDGKDSFVSDLFKPISKDNIAKLVEEIEIPLNFINALKLNREKYSRDIDNDAI